MSERHLDVTHDTTTRYSSRVAVAWHVAHLAPRSTARQQVRDVELLIEPAPSHRSIATDAFGNERLCFALYVPHAALHVRSHFRAHVLPAAFGEPESSVPWDELAAALQYRAGGGFIAEAAFAYPSPFVPLLPVLRRYAEPSFPPGRPVLEAAIDLMRRIHRDFRYESGSTQIGTPLEQVMRQKCGVCQDFAHLMIGCLRVFGVPAQYVSGYLLTQPPPGQPRLVGADASHAWVSVWCPTLGWNDLDPTNDVRPDTDHVTVAVGRDFGDVMPLRGVIQGGGDHTLLVGVTVTPITARDS